MSRNKWSLLLALFFLVQAVSLSPALSFENNSLNPPTNLDLNCPEGRLKKVITDAINLGISLYKMDAIGRKLPEDIKNGYSELSLNSRASFDLANMDLGKKGWTRYYPFSIGDKNFIMRIFLTAERSYQLQAPVLYEGSITDPAVTFQVLPPVSEMISDCKSKPRQIYYSSCEVNRSS